MRFTDPSGHFANIVIGAIVGAAVNVGLYMWNEVGRQDGFNWSQDGGDLLSAATQGALVGGLIGSGVGAGEGISLAMSAGLGAASSLVSTEVGNLITGTDYNATTSSIDAITGAALGVVTAGPGSNTTKNIAAGGVQVLDYALDTWATHDKITPQGTLGAFTSGVVNQAWTSATVSNMQLPIYEDYGTDTLTMVYPGASEQTAEIFSNLLVPTFQTAGESFVKFMYRLNRQYQDSLAE